MILVTSSPADKDYFLIILIITATSGQWGQIIRELNKNNNKNSYFFFFPVSIERRTREGDGDDYLFTPASTLVMLLELGFAF